MGVFTGCKALSLRFIVGAAPALSTKLSLARIRIGVSATGMAVAAE